ncbi:hypothetical protein B0H14DRAFT_2632986 [Mycena olivaceomarginata]|nr:hypothetical protein B0H14DRAFT_2632986 [Mycena olivaceomarginata]
MASRAADNLRTYFRKAALPETRRDPNAPLRQTCRLQPSVATMSASSRAEACAPDARNLLAGGRPDDVLGRNSYQMGGEQLPKQSLVVEDVDRESVERFAVPCDPTFDIPPHVGRRPTDIMRWVHCLSQQKII